MKNATELIHNTYVLHITEQQRQFLRTALQRLTTAPTLPDEVRHQAQCLYARLDTPMKNVLDPHVAPR